LCDWGDFTPGGKAGAGLFEDEPAVALPAWRIVAAMNGRFTARCLYFGICQFSGQEGMPEPRRFQLARAACCVLQLTASGLEESH
jgi:hypothetical protein